MCTNEDHINQNDTEDTSEMQCKIEVNYTDEDLKQSSSVV